MSAGDDACWVILPIAQQASGAWIDTLLHERLAEAYAKRGFPGDEPALRGRVEVFRDSDPEALVNQCFYQRGWTDGLPVVAPTVYRVREMLRDSPLAAGEVIGEMEPMRGLASVEKLAANAVMAGCRPEYFPVVLAATRAMLDPAFNLRGVQTTDENVAPLLVVSGPLADKLDINAGLGLLGPGWQANATIGRSLRLIMTNIGGGWPGVVALAGIGQPARYTLCLGERRQPPWPQLHVEAGLAETQSAVTLMRAECAINVTGDLDDIADVMGSAASAFSLLHGGRVAVLLAPHTAARLAAEGRSKADVAQYLFEHGRLAPEQWQRLWIRREIVPSYGAPEWVRRAEACGSIPVVESPDHIVIFVAGGDAPIAQHAYFPTWGFPACRITLPIVSART
jgi:hypothetical protein